MATVRDVAKRAGVSVATVSHVINKTRFVSKELRSRVFRAMEELNYRPNMLARSLRLGETRTIGLIVPDNANPFFAEVARVVENVGFEAGYNVILCNSDGQLEKELAYIEVPIAKQADGIMFIAAGSSSEHLQLLAENGVPVVVVDRQIATEAPADMILVDNFQGGYEATKYLINLGHQRIACITGPSDLTPSAERTEGYKHALNESGVPLDKRLVVKGDFRFRGGTEAMEKLLALDDPPTAVFACNDMMAIAVMSIAYSRGLKVPDDLSIVGFDNILQVSAMVPPLTTVAQPIDELGKSATELLTQRINGSGPESKQRIVLDTELIIRQSCAPPRS